MISGEDYYVEDGLIVMTAAYHIKRGSCCGSSCKWCPYEPKHQAGTTTLSYDGKLIADKGTSGGHLSKS